MKATQITALAVLTADSGLALQAALDVNIPNYANVIATTEEIGYSLSSL
jgi:hypothetical protein